MLSLFYSPHMTSVDNEARRASGHADIPLAPVGRQQAVELGQHYAAKTLDAVFCSDLQRAAETARLAFSKRNLPIITDARLRECDYGDLTQCPVEQVEKEFPRRITVPFPGGQSVLMVVQEVGAFLHEVLNAYDGKSIVVIGHRVTRYGLAYWLGNDALEDIVNAKWEWRDVPIWSYEVQTLAFEQRFRASFQEGPILGQS